MSLVQSSEICGLDISSDNMQFLIENIENR